MTKILLACAGVLALACDYRDRTSSFSPADCGKWIVTIANIESPEPVRFLADSIESHDHQKVVLYAEGKRAIWSGDDITLVQYRCP